MKPVKIVFVGVGNMGQMAHLKNYAELPDCRVVAIIEARNKLGKAVANRYCVDNTFPSIEKFRNAAVDFDGFVAVQHYRNQKNIMPELYGFEKPVLSEKPLALSVETGKELAALAQKHNAAHVIGYHKRSDLAMEFAKSLIGEWKASARFGKMRYLRATMPEGNWVAGGFDGVITSDEEYPECDMEKDVKYFDKPDLNHMYDSFVNYYIHQINAVRYLLGEDYHIKYAERTKALLAGESLSGKPVVIEMSPWRNSLDWQETYLLGFEMGWIRIDLPAPLAVNRTGKVTVYEDNGERPAPVEWSPTLRPVSAMKNQAINYIKFIAGEKPAMCMADEAVKDLELAKEYIELVGKLS